MKRREFFEKTVAGTAGIVLGASAVFPSCKGAGEKVVLSLIGSGSRGLSSIISCCKANALVEIKSVCDVYDLRTEKAVSEINNQLGYKPSITKNMKEVFDDRDVDAVWIATPDHWHALATLWACQAKKDVYVEKTPFNTLQEGAKMMEATKKYRRIVQVGFQNRSGACYKSARDYIQSGKLGQVVHIRIYNLLGGKKWMASPDEEIPRGLDWDAWLGPAPYRPYNPGVHKGWINYWDFNPGTMNDASHQLDLARMVMGDPGQPVSIYGWGGNHVLNSDRETPELQSITYDYGKFTMTCESGNTTSYMTKTPPEIRMDPNRFPEWKTNSERIEIYGTLGMMFLGRQGGGWQVFGPKEQLLAQEGGIHPDQEHQMNFIDCIRSRKQPNSEIGQAYLSASLVHFANIAYRTGNKQLIFDGENNLFTGNEAATGLIRTTYRDKYQLPEKV